MKIENILLYLNKEVFRPTETTKFLLEAVIKNFQEKLQF